MPHRPAAHVRFVAVGAVTVVLSATLLGCAPEPQSDAATPTPTVTSRVTPSPTPTADAAPTASPTPSSSAPTDDVRVTVATLDFVGDGVEATGIVPDIVEEGGTCTLTLEANGVVLTATGTATAATEATFCGLIAIRDERLTPGTWSASLSYASAQHAGTSDRLDVEVPA